MIKKNQKGSAKDDRKEGTSTLIREAKRSREPSLSLSAPTKPESPHIYDSVVNQTKRTMEATQWKGVVKQPCMNTKNDEIDWSNEIDWLYEKKHE